MSGARQRHDTDSAATATAWTGKEGCCCGRTPGAFASLSVPCAVSPVRPLQTGTRAPRHGTAAWACRGGCIVAPPSASSPIRVLPFSTLGVPRPSCGTTRRAAHRTVLTGVPVLHPCSWRAHGRTTGSRGAAVPKDCERYVPRTCSLALTNVTGPLRVPRPLPWSPTRGASTGSCPGEWTRRFRRTAPPPADERRSLSMVETLGALGSVRLVRH